MLDEQGTKLALHRRYQADMREIWMMQPRLEKRGRQSFTLVTQLRFRASYDFLLLRCTSNEIDPALGDWWTNFIDADSSRREQLVQESLGSAGKSGRNTRKRRRRRKSAPAENGTPAEGHGGASGAPQAS